MATKQELLDKKEELEKEIQGLQTQNVFLILTLDQITRFIQDHHPNMEQQQTNEDEMRVQQIELAEVIEELRDEHGWVG